MIYILFQTLKMLMYLFLVSEEENGNGLENSAINTATQVKPSLNVVKISVKVLWWIKLIIHKFVVIKFFLKM